ncbi:uncharacterized protein LOC127850832 isoform X2 [Dreissena polymorpha]|uniref:Bcl-2 Bcl-2 homology region 1-3 domain-containing protein n=1 Tax=Dreissena polymorpha TaxID=45954 RepID=A0A9D4D0T6_DREPO|nr:uncharacterized protein LOC127850832 isoform X2 [Dreissena polymorpha]KAH3736109.1 hypothetical protein DPMN_042671 [Dreissena polymorpha]
MSKGRKLKLKLIGDVDKIEEFQRETARLLEQFLQSDNDEQRPGYIQCGNFERKANETDSSDILRFQGFSGRGRAVSFGKLDSKANETDWSDIFRFQGISDGGRAVSFAFGNFESKDNETDMSDIKRHQGLPESKEAGDSTEDKDNIPQGVFGSRTELEQDLVRELRRIADEIDRNGKENICQSMKDVAGLMVYSSFKSTVKQYVGNLIGWGRVAFVFQFTKKAVQAAGRGGLNARQIRENCLRYIEDKCADWIVRHGGWASMLPADSDDSRPEVD